MKKHNSGSEECSLSKRSKSNLTEEENNWTLACKLVSGSAYRDCRKRFLLVYLPPSITSSKHDNEVKIHPVPRYAEESFITEIRNKRWHDALEVCHMCIKPSQYLSACILQEIIEIMLNFVEDQFSEYTSQYIIDGCKQILMQNFSTHPPNQNKDLRDCYIKFLTHSMPIKKNLQTYRNIYECEKGIIKYCLNRLEYEISADSNDEPIVKKYIPENLKDTVKGFHWQKQNFDTYESLNRDDRIKRLFSIFETVIEVMQFDLAIQQTRYSEDNLRTRCNRIMEQVLWPGWERGMARVNGTCRQIMRIFANIIHLQYPDSMVKTFTIWLNTMIETLYIIEIEVNEDYGKSTLNTVTFTKEFYRDIKETERKIDYGRSTENTVTFAREFYEIIKDLPHDSIIRILDRIEPSHMRHGVGLFYIYSQILPNFIDSVCIFKILEHFLTESLWKSYAISDVEIGIPKKLLDSQNSTENKITFLLNKCISPTLENMNRSVLFPKKCPRTKMNKMPHDLRHVAQALYITLNAALDSYKLQDVQDTWKALNEGNFNETFLNKYNSYSVSKEFVNTYRSNLSAINKLALLFNKIISQGKLPKVFNIFGNIKLLDLHF